MRTRLTVALSIMVCVPVVYWIGASALRIPLESTNPIHVSGRADFGDSEIFAVDKLTWHAERIKNPYTGQIPKAAAANEREYLRKAFPTSTSMEKTAAGHSTAVVSWSRRGPWNVGGRTRAAEFDIGNQNILLAGGVSGGLWRSEDLGRSWALTTQPDEYQGVTALAQDTRSGNEHIWYYGTGEASGSAYSPGVGIYKSVDSGRSWTHLSETASFEFVYRILVDTTRTDEDVVYVAAESGIYRTSNGGATWEDVLDAHRAYDIVLAPSGAIYVVTNDNRYEFSVYRLNAARQWEEISSESLPIVNRAVISASGSTADTLLVLAFTPSVGHCVSVGAGFGDPCFSLWRYSDASGEWENLTFGLGDAEYSLFAAYSTYNLAITTKPDEPSTVYFGGIWLHRSTDGYVSRENTSTTYAVHADQHLFRFSPHNSNQVLVATDGGVYLGTDVPWQFDSRNDGYLTSQFYSIAIDETTEGSTWIIGGTQDQGTWLSTDENLYEDWNYVYGGDGFDCAIDPENGHIFYSTQNGWVYRSSLSPSGRISNRVTISPEEGRNSAFFTRFALVSGGPAIMYYPGDDGMLLRNRTLGVPESGNDGRDPVWEPILDVGEWPICAVATSTRAPENRVYVMTADEFYRIDDAHSDDPAVSSFPSVIPMCYGSSLSVDPENGDRVLVGFSGYGIQSLSVSEDGGASWQDTGGNLEENEDGTGGGPAILTTEIVQLHSGASMYFAGTTSGLFSTYSLAGENTVWQREDLNGIGGSRVDDIAARGSDGYVVVATHGNGIFQGWIDEVSSDPVSNEKPVGERSISLSAFPNPAGASTTVHIRTPGPEHITLSAYDVGGRLLGVLLDEDVSAGHHTRQLSLLSYAPGPILLSVASATEQTALLLVKTK